MSKIYGWAGKILWVNLTTRETHTIDTMEYGPKYLGGRGVAARIAWEFIPRGVQAFDPENLLIIMTGTLTGTTAPFSGRTSICTLSPQGWPREWLGRSNFGGHWGPSLKYAGYDGLVIEGRSDFPVTLWINDDQVSILDASHLWGQGSIDVQKALMDELGDDIRVLTIGQAGENLSRIAIIATETESAAGQGGFGAVMGSKNLKAVAVRGLGAIHIAEPESLMAKSESIIEEVRTGFVFAAAKLDQEKVKQYNQRWQACTQQCAMKCGTGCRFYEVTGSLQEEKIAGQFHCVANFFPGIPNSFYDWKLKFKNSFEIRHINDNYGLNQWDLLLGILPWLRECKRAGILENYNGYPIDLNDPEFWFEVIHSIAFRQGMGDALAEGGKRAVEILGFGEEQAHPLYAAWGSAGHWDGHGDRGNVIYYPFWITPALQWAVDVRDPYSSSHGYTSLTMFWSPFRDPDRAISWDTIKSVGKRIYGTEKAVDPLSDYEGKEYAADFHSRRSVIKDSVSVDDTVFPMILSFNSTDGLCRAGNMLGINFEYHLFRSVTGLDLSLEEFNQASERILNVERAIQIRNYNRRRKDDESVIPYFEYTEWWKNPLREEKEALDRDQFTALLDRYYRLKGWDEDTGWPTKEKLAELDLEDISDSLYAEN